MKSVELSFIILTWNSERYIKKCITSISSKCKAEDINYEIIIIDNGSSDATRLNIHEMKPKKYCNLHLVELPENMGTTYPRNIGLKKATGKYVCILDSDTEFGDGSIRDAFIILSNDKSIGILAPKLILPNGRTQHSVKKFPTFLQKIKKIPKALFKIKVQDTDFYPNFPFLQESIVDSAISACWFFKRSLIKEVGYLDEKIFYAPEDLDYCIRVRKALKNILYYPKITIMHHTQQISHRFPLSKVSLSHFWGLLYYFRKHGGWCALPKCLGSARNRPIKLSSHE